MVIPNDQVLLIEKGLLRVIEVTRRVPDHVRDEIQIEFRREKHSYTLFVRRPTLMRPGETYESEVAKLTYVGTTGEWKLYWMRADLKWHRYPPSKRMKKIETMVREVDRDPVGCFWG